MIELEFAELHGPIFLHGTNLPPKLIVGEGPGKRRDIKLFYDRQERELLVHFKEKIAIVPRENVASMVESSKSAKIDSEYKSSNNFELKPRLNAQVDSPQAHVFAGPGHGKSNKEK